MRQEVVAFLARELDEASLRAAGWKPAPGPARWFATWSGGRLNQPYRMQGPSGAFTRHRGDAPDTLYRLDAEGGWVLDPATGKWLGSDAPVRLSELQSLTSAEVEALYELDDWGAWYFDYGVGSWQRADAPVKSYYLGEVELHEIDPDEAVRVATALGVPTAVPADQDWG